MGIVQNIRWGRSYNPVKVTSIDDSLLSAARAIGNCPRGRRWQKFSLTERNRRLRFALERMGMKTEWGHSEKSECPHARLAPPSKNLLAIRQFQLVQIVLIHVMQCRRYAPAQWVPLDVQQGQIAQVGERCRNLAREHVVVQMQLLEF